MQCDDHRNLFTADQQPPQSHCVSMPSTAITQRRPPPPPQPQLIGRSQRTARRKDIQKKLDKWDRSSNDRYEIVNINSFLECQKLHVRMRMCVLPGIVGKDNLGRSQLFFLARVYGVYVFVCILLICTGCVRVCIRERERVKKLRRLLFFLVSLSLVHFVTAQISRLSQLSQRRRRL